MGTISEAYPHLILDNLSSKLGQRTANILKHLFPVPKVRENGHKHTAGACNARDVFFNKQEHEGETLLFRGQGQGQGIRAPTCKPRSSHGQT